MSERNPMVRRFGLGGFVRDFDDLVSGVLLRDSSIFGGIGLRPDFDLDVKRDDDGLTVRADVPGIRQEDLDVKVENGCLTISGS